MKRLILDKVIHCPFCGCEKVFLKAETVKGYDFDPVTKVFSDNRRIKAAGQCAKCHIRGPYVYSEPAYGRGASLEVDDKLIEQVIAKWNERH